MGDPLQNGGFGAESHGMGFRAELNNGGGAFGPFSGYILPEVNNGGGAFDSFSGGLLPEVNNSGGALDPFSGGLLSDLNNGGGAHPPYVNVGSGGLRPALNNGGGGYFGLPGDPRPEFHGSGGFRPEFHGGGGSPPEFHVGGYHPPVQAGEPQQFARKLIDFYWRTEDATQEYTTLRGLLLVRNYILVADLTDLLSASGAFENFPRLAEIERINQDLQSLDLENRVREANLELLRRLLKFQPLLPVQSRRDISLANELKQYHGWKGEVTLIDGGPDGWQACLDDIADYELPLRH